MTIDAGILIGIILGVSGCSGTSAADSVQMPAPAVEVARVQQKDVPIQREWIGTLDGMVNAAIKAQVTGYLLTQNYTEGSFRSEEHTSELQSLTNLVCRLLL